MARQGYEFGVRYSQVSAGASPPGGWPQIKQVYGMEPTKEQMDVVFAMFRTQFDEFILDANIRFEPLLGFKPYPDINYFSQPVD